MIILFTQCDNRGGVRSNPTGATSGPFRTNIIRHTVAAISVTHAPGGRLKRLGLVLGWIVGVLGLAALPARSLHAQTGATSADTTAFLRPGDVIRVKVWREPDWSGDFEVDESGVATLPRLGAVRVTAMSPDSLRHYVVDSLSAFLKNPTIEVTALRRVQVLGAVRTPGLYPVAPTVTIGDVVALAGGATPEGKPDQVVLRRDGKDVLVKLTRATRLADTPIRTGDQLFVPQRGWVSRNAGLVAAGLSATTTLVVALLLR
jgi:polysaccharide biosynthesis/export protein VpsN